MLKTIVVPLDGSLTSEQAIPTARRLAERNASRLEIVMAYHGELRPSRTQGAPPLDPRLDAESRSRCVAYLKSVADKVRAQTHVMVSTELLEGPPAEVIAAHVAAIEPELVVMTTHGRGGVSFAWIGHVASSLIEQMECPVLLVRPDSLRDEKPEVHRFDRVLVPLDGTREAERAVDDAVGLVAGRDAIIAVVHVVTPATQLAELVGAAYSSSIANETASDVYVEDVEHRLRGRGLIVDRATLINAQPARAILQYGQRYGVDLIAVATHGGGQVSRWLRGSVADKLARSSPVPVLLCPATPARHWKPLHERRSRVPEYA